MAQNSGVSSYPGFESNGLNCIENSSPNQRGMEVWFKLTGVRVVQGWSYRCYTVSIFVCLVVPLRSRFLSD